MGVSIRGIELNTATGQWRHLIQLKKRVYIWMEEKGWSRNEETGRRDEDKDEEEEESREKASV